MIKLLAILALALAVGCTDSGADDMGPDAGELADSGPVEADAAPPSDAGQLADAPPSPDATPPVTDFTFVFRWLSIDTADESLHVVIIVSCPDEFMPPPDWDNSFTWQIVNETTGETIRERVGTYLCLGFGTATTQYRLGCHEGDAITLRAQMKHPETGETIEGATPPKLWPPCS